MGYPLLAFRWFRCSNADAKSSCLNQSCHWCLEVRFSLTPRLLRRRLSPSHPRLAPSQNPPAPYHPNSLAGEWANAASRNIMPAQHHPNLASVPHDLIRRPHWAQTPTRVVFGVDNNSLGNPVLPERQPITRVGRPLGVGEGLRRFFLPEFP